MPLRFGRPSTPQPAQIWSVRMCPYSATPKHGRVRTAGVPPSSPGRLRVNASSSILSPVARSISGWRVHDTPALKQRKDHLELTAGIARDPDLAWATITDVQQLSPNVKKLVLKVLSEGGEGGGSSNRWSFQAGQWVDFHIPSVDKVGGYSIASIPRELPFLDLVVKASKHPPAAWITERAQPGDRVQLRVGGEFVYQPPVAHATVNASPSSVLLIAGGVGINPVYSILRDILAAAADGDSCAASSHGAATTTVRTALLYSASHERELLFHSELTELARQFPGRFQLFLTSTANASTSEGDMSSDGTTAVEAAEASATPNIQVRSGRVTREMIGEALTWLGAETDSSLVGVGGVDDVYVCGPPGMAEEMVVECGSLGVPSERVHFESWW